MEDVAWNEVKRREKKEVGDDRDPDALADALPAALVFILGDLLQQLMRVVVDITGSRVAARGRTTAVSGRVGPILFGIGQFRVGLLVCGRGQSGLFRLGRWSRRIGGRFAGWHQAINWWRTGSRLRTYFQDSIYSLILL